jgi:site-specific DNA recombinase
MVPVGTVPDGIQGRRPPGETRVITMAVVGYTRISFEEKSRDGVSLAAQAEKVRLYCELHALGMLECVVDAGVSAKSLDRPGLSRVLAMLDSGEAAGLVVFKLDRLTRSLGDWSMLIDRYFGRPGGPSLFSVSDSIDTRTAAGRMVLNMMMTVAQWERETIVERTRGAMQFKKSRGERISGMIPYGADLAADGRTLVPNGAELAALEDVRRWHAEGWPLRRIAAELQARGVPTKSGRPWSYSTIATLLKRPT